MITTLRLDAAPAHTDPSSTQRTKIREAAEQFEALFVAQMLRSAREASGGDADQSGGVMMDVAEEQIALALSHQGGLGLTRSIVDQLAPLGPSAAPPVELSNSSQPPGT